MGDDFQGVAGDLAAEEGIEVTGGGRIHTDMDSDADGVINPDLIDEADDGEAAGDDLVDDFSDDPTPKKVHHATQEEDEDTYDIDYDKYNEEESW
jgi:hypothetical protein